MERLDTQQYLQVNRILLNLRQPQCGGIMSSVHKRRAALFADAHLKSFGKPFEFYPWAIVIATYAFTARAVRIAARLLVEYQPARHSGNLVRFQS